MQDILDTSAGSTNRGFHIIAGIESSSTTSSTKPWRPYQWLDHQTRFEACRPFFSCPEMIQYFNRQLYSGHSGTWSCILQYIRKGFYKRHLMFFNTARNSHCLFTHFDWLSKMVHCAFTFSWRRCTNNVEILPVAGAGLFQQSNP